MIHFTCRCHHVFDFPDDMAGKQVQCPSCQLLVDVPTKADLAELSDDGTFRLDETPVLTHPGDFENMRRVFSKEKVDDDGAEFDLRQTHEELVAAGTHDDINEFENHPTAPRYDPETGELVRPLAIAPDPAMATPASQLPMATNTLNYASGDLAGRDSWMSPLRELLNPVNLAAMFFVLLAHIFFFLAAFSLFLSVFALFVVGTGLVAHYANVIDEIGIEEHDELPRFLRNFNFTDDIWRPFAHVFLAWMLCFGAARFVWLLWMLHNWPIGSGLAVSLVLDTVGLFFFPAVVLTTTTSGSLENLRPDRVFKVIARIGPRYALLVLLYAVAITVYSLGFVTTPIHALLWASLVKSTPWYFTAAGAYGFLIAGIFLMHYFAWLVGLTYRTLHHKFPWAYHQHVKLIPGVTGPRYARQVRGFPVQVPPPHAPNRSD